MKVDNCKEHPNKKIDYYCLDKFCKKNSACCMICIKNKHQTCEDNFIITKNEQNKLKILPQQSDPSLITSKLN